MVAYAFLALGVLLLAAVIVLPFWLQRRALRRTRERSAMLELLARHLVRNTPNVRKRERRRRKRLGLA